jgi:tetratricopeptide (TPR) repeat protein
MTSRGPFLLEKRPTDGPTETMFVELYLVIASLTAESIPTLLAKSVAATDRVLCFSDSTSPDRRIAACSALIRSDKQNPQLKAAALLGRAGAYGQKGDYARAADDATNALKRAHSAVAYYTRALAYHDMGREQQAIRDCEAALAIEPDNENALFVRGSAREGLADYAGAIKDFSDVLRRDPKRADALFSRGAAYYSAGDYEAAVDDFTKTIEIGHDDATVFYLRGLAKKELGQLSGARSDFEEALRRDPQLGTETPSPALPHI